MKFVKQIKDCVHMTFDMSWTIALLLFGAGILGGAINAVAGGATLFTFPAMMAAGLSPISANASSSVALTPGHLCGRVVGAQATCPLLMQRCGCTWLLPRLVAALGQCCSCGTPDRVFTALVPCPDRRRNLDLCLLKDSSRAHLSAHRPGKPHDTPRRGSSSLSRRRSMVATLVQAWASC